MKLTINQILQQAIAAQKEGRVKDAEYFYRSILRFKPKDPDANYNFGILAASMNNSELALSLFKTATEANPRFIEAYYNSANMQRELGRLEEAAVCYEKAIQFKPNFFEAHCNLGSILRELGRLKEAEISFNKAIEFKPKFVEAHCNLGNTLKDLGRVEEAMECYENAISIDSKYIEPRYNLGLILFNKKKYIEAAEHFKLINFQQSKNYLLKCLYLTDQQSNFYKQLDKITDKEKTNAVIGSLISRSEIRYKVNRPNPFCNEPLEYVLKTDLYKKYDFENTFIKTVNKILKDDKILDKTQGHLTNGRQTAGNLFALEGNHIDKVEEIIRTELEEYRIHFKDSKEGFIKNWPNSFKIKGWLINMKSGGKLSAHMHDTGWITGSVYINVPLKLKTNSGNLVVCLDYQENDKTIIKKEKNINVTTGSLCLFPASLLHYTIPFQAEENRVVLAFDVIPK